MDDHLPLESPAVDQLQVLLTPPAIIQKLKGDLCSPTGPLRPLTSSSSPKQTQVYGRDIQTYDQ